MLSSAVCLDVMIVQELRCFPYGHSWARGLSNYLPAVVLQLIMQDGRSAVGPVWGLVSSRNWRYGGEDGGASSGRHQEHVELTVIVVALIQSMVRYLK